MTSDISRPSHHPEQLSKSKYAESRKELLELVKQLRAIGAQADLDLPRIVVIGNQSAGKSSVVEAISGINVPRDAGTCTRCPMECRLSSSTGPWSCQVSIRWEFDSKGNRKEEVSEVPFGNAITNKSDVELALRRAQAAVLNPHLDPPQLLAMSAEQLQSGIKSGRKALPFSRNVVCVDLEGPDLTDLAFIDLPGIIQNAEPDVVKLVEDLVVSHIEGNCLILVALPMIDDIENQKALRLAHQADLEGKRTIGVLTKPDMLSSGTKARNLWLDVIEGRRSPLLHGYYCTRQPDDAERAKDVTSAHARHTEATFFETNAPWSTSAHKHRFGIPNLVATLSALLEKIIKDTLPRVSAEATNHLELCDRELSDMPEPMIGEPTTYMLNLVTTFCTTVDHYARGTQSFERLIQENRSIFRTFKSAIRSTAPNFVPYIRKEGIPSTFQNYIGDGEDEGPGEGLISKDSYFYLDDMTRHINKSITRELPDNVPFPAKVTLIDAFQSQWEAAAHICFDLVRDVMVEVLFTCMKATFYRWENLYAHLRAYVNELVKSCYAECQQYIATMLEVERAPFTQNTHYLQTCTDKWLVHYSQARAGNAVIAQGSSPPPAKKSKIMDADGSAIPHIAQKAPSPLAPPAQSPAARKTPAGSSATKNGAAAARGGGFPGLTFTGLSSAPSPFGASAAASASSTRNANPFTFGGSGTTAAAATFNVSIASNAGPASPAQAQPTPASPAQARSTPASIPAPSLSDVDTAQKVNTALAALAELGYTGLKAEDLGKLNPVDEYQTELEVMAEVRGYFQVAYKRVIDNIPSLIDHMFIKAIKNKLQTFLINKMALGAPDAPQRCARLLAEDPNIVARRDELTLRKKRLENVRAELYNFGL